MSFVITLPQQLYERLTGQSRRLKRTPEDVVVTLVQRYLSQVDTQWQTEFQSLLTRIHSRTAAFPSAEIEADITLAAAEARELRRARRAA